MPGLETPDVSPSRRDAPPTPEMHAPGPRRSVARLRIASCINSMSPSGGSELNAVRTAGELVRRGHHLVAVTLTDDRSGMWERYRGLGVEVAGFPVTSLVSASALRQIRAAAAFFRQERFDIVHSHDCYSNFLMVPAARLAGIPVIASKRWTDYTFRQHAYTDRVAFSLATAVLTNSALIGRSLGRDGDTTGPIVIPNFVDDEVFLAPAERTRWRQRFGLDDDDLVFGIVAQLRSEKNHPLLIKAFADLLPDYPRARLLIVGEGAFRKDIERAIREAALGRAVIMAGHLERAWRAYAAMDIAVLPSQHEGFPNALVEAMAAGRPVVASDVGGIPDAVVNGQTGLLVPPNDQRALHSALRQLAQDEPLRVTLAAAARQHADTHYRAGVVIAALERAYRALLRECST